MLKFRGCVVALVVLAGCADTVGFIIITSPPPDAGPPSEPPIVVADASGNTDTSLATDGNAAADAPDAESPALYYGACLSELAFSQPKPVFNFYTHKIPMPDGGIMLSLQPLAVVNRAPPPTVSKAATVGLETTGTLAPPDPAGISVASLGTLSVPGSANPISGSDFQVDQAKLLARLGSAIGFCARMAGNVVKPAAAERTLDPAKNVCHFVSITEDAATPVHSTAADFAPETCP